MVISNKNWSSPPLLVNNHPTEQVKTFRYFSCLINDILALEQEIKGRTEQASTMFLKIAPVLDAPELKFDRPLSLIKYYVYSFLLYGMEVWTFVV